jgi:hypothetical protein
MRLAGTTLPQYRQSTLGLDASHPPYGRKKINTDFPVRSILATPVTAPTQTRS